MPEKVHRFITLNSKAIKDVSWADNVLYVLYRNDNLYEYRDVEKSVYDELLSVMERGESVGSFVSNNIRNRYEYSLLEF